MVPIIIFLKSFYPCPGEVVTDTEGSKIVYLSGMDSFKIRCLLYKSVRLYLFELKRDGWLVPRHRYSAGKQGVRGSDLSHNATRTTI